MVRAIRNTIRNKAKELEVPKKPGYIKISLVPSTAEADEMLGGLSDFPRSTPLLPAVVEDVASYEYKYSLNPIMGFAEGESSSYANITVKKKTVITSSDDENSNDRVLSQTDFLEIMIRVSGADDKNKVLAKSAYDAILPFFGNGNGDYAFSLR